MRTKRIDAHQHFLPVFEPAVLGPELDRAGVDATVLVQAVDTAEENDRLLAYAADVPYVAGVVGWLPLADPPAARAERQRLRIPPVVGVRCLIGREPSDWLVAPATLELFRELAAGGLAWDVVPVTERQVEHVCRVASAVPELRIVVDHLARPPVDTAGWEPWNGWVERLAAYPNVALKVSVGIDALTAWPRWDPAVLLPFLGWAVTHFGAERLLLASNWPVILQRRPYADVWSDLIDGLRQAGLDDGGLTAVRGETAARWYQL